MYVGVDIGGTKTLVAALDAHGVIKEQARFPTPHNYDHFLLEVRHSLAHFKTTDFQAGGIGAATVLDREHGIGLKFGNLPWKNVHLQHDLERICHCPMVIDNDAKMAALSEAMLLKHDFSRVLYVTVSTGIGYGLVVDQKIDDNIGDAGGRSMMLYYNGKPAPWETFASGHAIVERYGKMAKDITDEATWHKIARDIAKGLIELIAVTEPEAIVIGGSVGDYFERYGNLLAAELKNYHLPLLTLPVLRQAQRPDEAVIYGCYDLAKQNFAHAA